MPFMRLDAYLRGRKISYRAFARELNRDAAEVSRWASGQRTPDLKTAALIRALTGGEVTFDDFLPAKAEAA